MPLLATIVLDLGLAVALMFSLFAAFCWGELCGIRPGRDKSGLGGFVAIYMFFIIRWLGVALASWATARPGEVWWLLAAHTLLGVLSVHAFGHGLERVQHDRWAPPWLGMLAGAVLPAPALALSLLRVNSEHGDSLAIIAAVTAVLAALHALCVHRRRVETMR